MPAGARRSDVGEVEGQRVDSRSIRRNWPLFDLTRFDIRPTLDVVSRAVATMNKMWRRPRSRRVETRPSRSIEFRVFARDFGRSRGNVAARELLQDQDVETLA